MGKLSRLLFLAMLVCSLGLFGCADDGDDGRDGAAGASAYEIAGGDAVWGSEQAWLDSLKAPVSTVPPVETCYMCHDEGKIAPTQVAHELDREVTFTVATPPTVSGNDLVVAFNIAVNGAPFNSFTAVQRAIIFQGVNGVYTRYQNSTAVPTPSTSIALGVLDSVNNGVYTLRIPGAAAYVGTNARVYFRLQAAAVGEMPARRASIFADDAAYVRPDLASDEACINCHGGFAGGLTSHHYNPFLVSNCVACHSAVNPPADLPLAYLIHGIHNSHNMPGGHFTIGSDEFSVTYPTYMLNCSVCHDTAAGADAAVDGAVSYALCMSCHGDWSSFSFEGTAAPFKAYHQTLTAASQCGGCHPGAAPGTVSEFHNGLLTDRSGLIWDGRDVSVDEGAKVNMQITGVSYNEAKTQMSVTWTASYDGGAVNPCNTTVAVGAPIFHAGGAANTATGQAASNLSILRAYAQGDDFINPGIGTSPGQPVSTNLSTSNTSCAANVATTTITLTDAEQATAAIKGMVALQGKAQVMLPGATDYGPSVAGTQNVFQVRSKTPTREFMVGSGTLPIVADQRRAIADTDGCLKCHVGSLYQHGGNRIDNVTMCIMCHNEASSEQNVRALDGVDASEAYDGQASQTYGFKSLLHAIHSTGTDVNPNKITMIYRTNGVYVWAPEGVTPPNWPGTGWQMVYGSSAPHGTGAGNGVYRSHYLYSPTYPRDLRDCSACHVANFTMVPDQATSMATTINAGTVNFTPGAPPYTGSNAPSGSGTVAVNGNQLDDTLEGTGAAACASCHQTVKAHVYQNGWAPAVFPNGRQTIIDTVK